MWVAEVNTMKTTPTSTFKLEPILALFLFLIISCSPDQANETTHVPEDSPYLMILGTAQDAGFPQAGTREEFKLVESGKRNQEYAVSLSLVDPENGKRYLFEATPDFREQLEIIDKVSKANNYPFDGIFLTHAHIGHYTGLLHMSFEAMSTNNTAIYAMPRMKNYLETNGPWSQMVNFENIAMEAMQDSTAISLSENIKVMPFTVPHRDEYSETVGFRISVNDKNLVFIPDIDKWEKWDVDIKKVVMNNDYILIDASFYADGELLGRDMSKIPHPFTTESMALFKNLSASDKAKIHFIHTNHSNPILDSKSKEYREVINQGFKIAKQGQVITFN